MTRNDISFAILMAGLGTRNLPHSKGLPHKALLPIGDERTLDRVLREPISAGIKHIILVVLNAEVQKIIENGLQREPQIEAKLAEKGDHTTLELLRRTYIPEDVSIKFVHAEPKGIAYGIGRAAEVAEGRHVMACYPDDIIIPKEKGSPGFVSKMLDHYEGAMGGRGNLFATRQVEDPSRWGVIQDGYVLEKKPLATSREASISSYILDNKVVEKLNEVARAMDTAGSPESDKYAETGREVHYSEYLNDMVASDPSMAVQTFNLDKDYDYLDCGTLKEYERALIYTLLRESVNRDALCALAAEILANRK